MINEIENKKIFAFCIANFTTGGCELIHQLVDYLNNNGRDAYIVYIGNGSKEIPSPYLKYNIKVSEQIEDTENSIVVIDEGFMYLAKSIKKAHVMLWWLSVDNFFLEGPQMPYHSILDMRYSPSKSFDFVKRYFSFCLHNIKIFFNCKLTFSIKDLKNLGEINAYQSEYARIFLSGLGFKNLVPLKDFINTDFITSSKIKKENIILYNPKKGKKYTDKLIECDPSLKWVPLINMSREEMLHTLQRSKLYVDFGNHPGKDRIPREAALNGCVVITGRRGAANNDVDIPLPDFYKFNEKSASISDILERFHFVFDNYESCIKEQCSYKELILKEKNEFESQIDDLFKIVH